MPKETFENLTLMKKQRIDTILLEIFTSQSLSQVKVSDIVTKMEMSRGAFYKYFEDITDAYHYITNKYVQIIHNDLLQLIENSNYFFDGIEQYLIGCSDLDKDDNYWRGIQLLTVQSNETFAKRSDNLEKQSKMLQNWLDMLEKNHILMKTRQEAVSFLYFVMQLVIHALSDFIVNQWTTDELVIDFRYKVKWLENGIKS